MIRLSLCAYMFLTISYVSAMETAVDTKNAASWTPLHAAVSVGNSAGVTALIGEGACINAKTSPGCQTPLMFSAEYNHLKIVTMLLAEPDIVLDETDSNHSTALHIACKRGFADIVEALAFAGASIETDFGSGSALHHAFYSSNACVFTALQQGLKRKKDTEKEDLFPLHSACKADDPEVMEELVRNGVCVTDLDESGNSPLHYAAVNPNVGMLYKLLAAMKSKQSQ